MADTVSMTRPLPYTDSAHQRAHQFLVEEAAALDEQDYERWFGLLSEDIHYRVPIPVTTARGVASEERSGMTYLDENLHSLRQRIDRMATEHAWSEDPPSRTRRLVTNVLTFSLEQNELRVSSYLILLRSRGDVRLPDLLSAARTDVLRAEGDGEMRLARRTVKLDESVLRTHNLSFFL